MGPLPCGRLTYRMHPRGPHLLYYALVVVRYALPALLQTVATIFLDPNPEAPSSSIIAAGTPLSRLERLQKKPPLTGHRPS